MHDSSAYQGHIHSAIHICRHSQVNTTSMGKKHRISANKLSKYKSFRDLSTNPKTQESFYNSKNVSEHILTFVKQSPNTFSNTCKDLARRCFGLSEPPSGMLCDHVDSEGKQYRQVSAKWTRAGRHGTWELLQPSRPWDYLPLVYLAFKGPSYYRLSREKFNELCELGIIKKIRSRQQESQQTEYRYSLNKRTSFNGRPETFLAFAERMNKHSVPRRLAES